MQNIERLEDSAYVRRGFALGFHGVTRTSSRIFFFFLKKKSVLATNKAGGGLLGKGICRGCGVFSRDVLTRIRYEYV